MIWVLLGILVTAEAAKLDNTYLPPPLGAKESGGSDGALQLPLEPPYIDQYTPEADPPAPWAPGTRSLQSHRKPSKPEEENTYLENEEDIAVPVPAPLEKGRFISGSYSYKGPDDVLVTVTYKATDKKGRKDNGEGKEEDDEAEDGVNGDEEAKRNLSAEEAMEDEEEEDDRSVVPTPPSLPAELARAFEFHNKKQSEQEGKTDGAKKPIRKIQKKKTHYQGHPLHGGHKKGTTAGYHNPATNQPQKFPLYPSNNHNQVYPQYSSNNQNLYPSKSQDQYAPQNQYGSPTIHQGYSYPKHS